MHVARIVEDVTTKFPRVVAWLMMIGRGCRNVPVTITRPSPTVHVSRDLSLLRERYEDNTAHSDSLGNSWKSGESLFAARLHPPSNSSHFYSFAYFKSCTKPFGMGKCFLWIILPSGDLITNQ